MTRALPFALAALSATVAASAAIAGPLSVKDAWTRPAAAGGTAAGYLTIVNGGAPDLLVGAESPVAERVEAHASSMKGGMMMMAPEPTVPAPAGGQAAFTPGGRHLMLIGLKRALKTGDHVPVTLRFKSGQRLAVDLTVRTTPPAGAPKPMGDMRGMR
jgi:hypothetical protein